jgi:hypothetical protein
MQYIHNYVGKVCSVSQINTANIYVLGKSKTRAVYKTLTTSLKSYEGNERGIKLMRIVELHSV